MRKHMKITIPFIILALSGLLLSCGDKFLDVKPDIHQRVPVSVEDFQALLDNTITMNQSSCHALGIIGSDDYFVKEAAYQAFPVDLESLYQKNAYLWAAKIYSGGETTTIDWNIGFLRILSTNLILEGLQKTDPVNTDKKNVAVGSALFHRALNYYSLAQLYCVVYNGKTAENDMGLPLRLSSDVTLNVKRSTLKQTYEQITSDLVQAERILPERPLNIFRPGKAAAYSLLSRLYLQKGDYEKVIEYTTKVLTINRSLNDFNKLVSTPNYSFQVNGVGNSELIFMNSMANLFITNVSYFNADESLLNSYELGDLRKQVYFKSNTNGQQLFMGSYTGNNLYFTGFATDELYLARAEGYARTGRLTEALSDINYLRQNRYTKTALTDLSSSDKDQVLDWIINERRKEMVMRGTRWEDLRRLNKEPRYATTLQRKIGSVDYYLRPNSNRYAWPIPVDAVERGGYEQNMRD